MLAVFQYLLVLVGDERGVGADSRVGDAGESHGQPGHPDGHQVCGDSVANQLDQLREESHHNAVLRPDLCDHPGEHHRLTDCGHQADVADEYGNVHLGKSQDESQVDEEAS